MRLFATISLLVLAVVPINVASQNNNFDAAAYVERKAIRAELEEARRRQEALERYLTDQLMNRRAAVAAELRAQRELERKKEAARRNAIREAEEAKRRRLEQEQREQRQAISRIKEEQWKRRHTGCDSATYSDKLNSLGLEAHRSVEGICVSTDPAVSGSPLGAMTDCPPCR